MMTSFEAPLSEISYFIFGCWIFGYLVKFALPRISFANKLENSSEIIFNSRCHPLKRLLFRRFPFYNSKNLNCIGALSFFKDLFTHFHDF